jgi:hypothetical protein
MLAGVIMPYPVLSVQGHYDRLVRKDSNRKVDFLSRRSTYRKTSKLEKNKRKTNPK